MEEKKILRGELLKNTFSTFISFTILVLIFNVVIYKRVEIMLYESIDEELKNITDSDGSFVVNPRTIYIIRDIEGHIINQNSLGRLYDDYLDLVEFDSKNLNTIYTLKELMDTPVNMFTTVFIGNSQTKVINGKMVTPRGYKTGGEEIG